MPFTDHRLVRFFREKNDAGRRDAGIRVFDNCVFFSMHLGYIPLANPAMVAYFVIGTWVVEVNRIRIDCSFAVLLAAMSNLVFWIPVTRYVVIPLTAGCMAAKGRIAEGRAVRRFKPGDAGVPALQRSRRQGLHHTRLPSRVLFCQIVPVILGKLFLACAGIQQYGKQDPHFLVSRWHDGDGIAIPQGHMASLSLRYGKPPF